MIVNRNLFENAQGVIYPQSAVVCDLFPNTSSTFIGGFQILNTERILSVLPGDRTKPKFAWKPCV